MDRNQSETEEETTTDIKEYVFVHDNGFARMVEVKSGIQDNTHIQILSGLDDGQEVIIGPYRAVSRSLKNGDEIEVVDKEKLFNE